LEKLKTQPQELLQDILLPRRREILEIIRDYPHCSFNFTSRRFLSVNPKIPHYDLKQLQKKGFIIKMGKTRGQSIKQEGK
jgi:predicted transcriptional regulator